MLLATFKYPESDYVSALQVESQEVLTTLFNEFNDEHQPIDVKFYPIEEVEERYISSKGSIDKVWCMKDKALRKIVLSGKYAKSL